jgi:hypothetical protein
LKIFEEVDELGNFFLLIVGKLPGFLDGLSLIEAYPMLVLFVLSLMEGVGQFEVDWFWNEDGLH